jgi:hypothetical protein
LMGVVTAHIHLVEGLEGDFAGAASRRGHQG